MNLQHRVELFVALGDYLKKGGDSWQEAKFRASKLNPWFTESFIDIAAKNIIDQYLNREKLSAWVSHYRPGDANRNKLVGIVMAGNIPMVGFHDLLTVFMSGNRQKIKMSSKDDVLMSFIIDTLATMDPGTKDLIEKADMLKGCDAYIATGSNQSARYFDYYFSKYPHIIRRNKTSVAILDGTETEEELLNLSDDIHLFFGLGCRNVTKLYVPEDYDFKPLLASFNRYSYLREIDKYANNYDYQLTLLLMNKMMYMSNETTLLVEQESPFSAIGTVHYSYYTDREKLASELEGHEAIQCIVGKGYTAFGQAQEPGLFSYADGVDTFAFLLNL